MKDKKGNTILDKKGNPVTRQVKDGTVTYYDLWPGGDGANKNNVSEDISGVYNSAVTTIDKLTNTDITGSEDRVPDGIIQLKTSAYTDELVNSALSAYQNANSMYNGISNNYSDYAKTGIEYAAPIGYPLDNTDERVGGRMVTTPNYLYNATTLLPNATVIKSAGNKTNNGFVDAVVGRSGLRRKAANSKIS